MNNNIEVLEEVLDVLEEEKRKFYNLINQNEFRIEEINSYLRELSKKEDEDFKVFSPRNVENVHREQIEADTSEKEKYEKENAEYNKKIEALKVLIDKVNIVIENLHFFNEKDAEILKDDDVISSVENNINDEPEEYIDYKKNDSDNSVKDEKEDVYSKDDVVEADEKFNVERRHIAHQILNCVSYITFDRERAKIELTALSKKLME